MTPEQSAETIQALRDARDAKQDVIDSLRLRVASLEKTIESRNREIDRQRHNVRVAKHERDNNRDNLLRWASWAEEKFCVVGLDPYWPWDAINRIAYAVGGLREERDSLDQQLRRLQRAVRHRVRGDASSGVREL